MADRVDVYTRTETGATLATSFGEGTLTDPLGIAVDQDTGAIYVSDATDVRRYAADETLDPLFPSLGVTGPLAFDHVADELLVADTAADRVRRFSTIGIAGPTWNGTGGGGTAFAGLQDIAVDGTGDVLVVDSDGDPEQGTGTSRVERYASGGAHEATYGPVYGAATVAAEHGTDRVIVSGNQDAVNRSEWPTLQVFDKDTPATAAETIAPDSSVQYSTIRALAHDGRRLFAGTDTSVPFPTWGHVSIQIYTAVAPPTITVEPASDVTATGAKLTGAVNPDGTATEWRFEYRRTGADAWLPADDWEDAGPGTAPVPVSRR